MEVVVAVVGLVLVRGTARTCFWPLITPGGQYGHETSCAVEMLPGMMVAHCRRSWCENNVVVDEKCIVVMGDYLSFRKLSFVGVNKINVPTCNGTTPHYLYHNVVMICLCRFCFFAANVTTLKTSSFRNFVVSITNETRFAVQYLVTLLMSSFWERPTDLLRGYDLKILDMLIAVSRRSKGF